MSPGRTEHLPVCNPTNLFSQTDPPPGLDRRDLHPTPVPTWATGGRGWGWGCQREINKPRTKPLTHSDLTPGFLHTSRSGMGRMCGGVGTVRRGVGGRTPVLSDGVLSSGRSTEGWWDMCDCLCRYGVGGIIYLQKWFYKNDPRTPHPDVTPLPYHPDRDLIFHPFVRPFPGSKGSSRTIKL